MANVIKTELFRFMKGKTIRILLILGLVFTIMQVVVPIKQILVNISGPSSIKINPILGYEAFFMIDFSTLLFIFTPFLVVTIFISKVALAPVENIIATRIKRKNIYISKYIIFVSSIIGLSLSFALFATSITTIINGWGKNFEFFQLCLIFLVSLRISIIYILYGTILILLSLFIHNTVLIVIIHFGISIVESMFISIIDAVIAAHNSKVLYYLSFIFPSKYMSDFAKVDIKTETLILGLSVSLLSIIILYITSLNIFLKKDIHSCFHNTMCKKEI